MKEWRVTANVSGLILEVMKIFWISKWWRLHKIVNIPKATEFFILKRWIFCYVNYISIKKKKKGFSCPRHPVLFLKNKKCFWLLYTLSEKIQAYNKQNNHTPFSNTGDILISPLSLEIIQYPHKYMSFFLKMHSIIQMNQFNRHQLSSETCLGYFQVTVISNNAAMDTFFKKDLNRLTKFSYGRNKFKRSTVQHCNYYK